MLKTWTNIQVFRNTWEK